MSCPESEEIDAALPPSGYSTLTKPKGNDESNAERMETESEADVEKQFDKSTGKTRQDHPFLEYLDVGRWATGQDSELEPAEIKQAIKKHMKKFMQDSRLMIAPATDPEKKKTDIALWKQREFEGPPNICSAHLTSKLYFIGIRIGS